MKTYLLSNNDIAVICEEIEKLLYEYSDRKAAIKIRLLTEEALIRWQHKFGEDTKISLRIKNKKHSLGFTLSLAGISFNPFEQDLSDEDMLINRMAAETGLFPQWSYSRGVNSISWQAEKKRLSLTVSVCIALVSGIILGLLCNLLPDNVCDFIYNNIIRIISDAFVSLISGISMPMIFVAIVYCISGIGNSVSLSKMGVRLVGKILLLSFVICGLFLIINIPFYNISFGTETSLSDNLTAEILQLIANIIPPDILSPFITGNTLQIIFIAVILGCACLVIEKKVPTVISIIEQVNSIINIIMKWISNIIPFFIAINIIGLIIQINQKTYSFAGLLQPIIIVLSLFVVIFIAYIIIISVKFKLSPVKFIKSIMPSFIICLTTASSATAYSTTVDVCEKKLGINSKYVGFGIPLGQVLYMPGCLAMYGSFVMFVASESNITITPSWLIMLFIMLTAVVIAAPPTAGGPCATFTMLFSQLLLPTDLLPIVITLSVFFDFSLTAINIMSIQSELLLTSDKLGMLNRDILEKNNK